MLSIKSKQTVRNPQGQKIKNPEEGDHGRWRGEESVFHQAWGWMTLDERFDLRQTDPRMAP